MTKLTRKKLYKINKAAKTGEEIMCPVCKETFIKKQYSQAFCCSHCKDVFWNAKCSNRHADSEYHRKYNNKAWNREERVAYARENCRILIGNGYDKHQFDYLMFRENDFAEGCMELDLD